MTRMKFTEQFRLATVLQFTNSTTDWSRTVTKTYSYH